MTTYRTRAELPADVEAVRAVEIAAFPTESEADLVDALRADPDAWVPALSHVVVTDDDACVGHALLTRCTVGGLEALALAPCAVTPEHQGRGAGSAVIRSVLDAAAKRTDVGALVVVLGSPAYYSRFGFTNAAHTGVHAGFEHPAGALMTLALTFDRPLPGGLVAYPPAFAV